MLINFIGDSLVLGTRDPAGLGWPGRLLEKAQERGASFTCYNLGVRKNTSRDILSRWRPEVEARVLPGVEGRAMFSFGVGDAAPGRESGTTRVPLEETGANARSVLTDCLDTCGLLMVGPPPVLDEAFRERVARVAATLESVCREAGVGYLDIFGPLNSGRNYLKDLEAGDGIHPGRPGYNMIAELVWDWKAWQDWMAEIEN